MLREAVAWTVDLRRAGGLRRPPINSSIHLWVLWLRKKYTGPFWPSPEQLELERQVSLYLFWLHMLDEGQEVGDGFGMLRVLCEAFADTQLLEAIKVIDETKQRGTWRKSDLVTIVAAINVIDDKPTLSKQQAKRVLQMQGVTV